MYFHDHSFVPLFIQVSYSKPTTVTTLPMTHQENYLKTQPAKVSKLSGVQAQLKQLQLMDQAASSISDGDLVDAMIHGFVAVSLALRICC